MQNQSHKFLIAPMMDWTDRHCRVLHRLLTRRALLYTEMVTTGAVIHGNREKLLGFDPIEHPVALQLGGSDAGDSRQRRGDRRGARLRRDQPQLRLPVGSRAIGPLRRLPDGGAGTGRQLCRGHAERVARARHRQVPHRHRRSGCRGRFPPLHRYGRRGRMPTFIVHARKAWLSGLSPKENREVPPLDYDRVYRLKQERPELTIVINGGIPDLDAAIGHLAHVDGVMLGRVAYQTPYVLAEVDRPRVRRRRSGSRPRRGGRRLSCLRRRETRRGLSPVRLVEAAHGALSRRAGRTAVPPRPVGGGRAARRRSRGDRPGARGRCRPWPS